MKHDFAFCDKPILMGIVNLTSDSFFPNSRCSETESAIMRAKKMIEAGASIIDVGAESTRPNYTKIDSEEEIKKVVPFIKELRTLYKNLTISIDTQKSIVAKAACEAGANMINDIWGLQQDSNMAKIARDFNCNVVIMANNAEANAKIDIIKNTKNFFSRSLKIAKQNGIRREKIILDVGIGFGKTQQQNYAILKNIKKFHCFKLPLLLGTSRKSLYKELDNSEVEDRLSATIATSIYAAQNKVSILRLHDIFENRQALQLYQNLTSKNSEIIKWTK